MPDRCHRHFDPDFYPLPEHLQLAVERNIGRPPVWKFPQPAPAPEGLVFERLDFETRRFLLETFQNDPDTWVDERFKTPENVHAYAAMQCIEMPFSRKHGGCDWLVFTPENECAGVLHCFDFSKERFGFNHRTCAVGFAFGEKFRGSPLPAQAVRHFERYLFEKMDRLCLVAWAKTENARCCRFLEKLGWLEQTDAYKTPDEATGVPEFRYFETYRSNRTRAGVLRRRAEAG